MSRVQDSFNALIKGLLESWRAALRDPVASSMLLSHNISTPPKNLHSAPLTGIDSAEVN